MPENEDLQPGASFADIAIQPAETDESQDSTPPEQDEDDAAATEGGQEPEVPGILKDAEQDEEEKEDDGPDLSLSDDLNQHPILKAKWEAYVAQKERGIDKWMAAQSAKLQEAETFKESWAPLVGFYERLNDPETVDEAFGELTTMLEKHYGRSFVGAATAESEPFGESKYGLEFASDDKVVEVTKATVVAELERLLDARLGPMADEFKSRQAEREAQSKAEAAVPALRAQFEIAADPWVTPELAARAMKQYPGLDPVSAFSAAFVKEIARYTAKHSASSAPRVRNLPAGHAGTRQRAELEAGASFLDILGSEATLA